MSGSVEYLGITFKQIYLKKHNNTNNILPHKPPGAGPFPALQTSHLPEPLVVQLTQFPVQPACVHI